jgi:hypothetical protein
VTERDETPHLEVHAGLATASSSSPETEPPAVPDEPQQLPGQRPETEG